MLSREGYTYMRQRYEYLCNLHARLERILARYQGDTENQEEFRILLDDVRILRDNTMIEIEHDSR